MMRKFKIGEEFNFSKIEGGELIKSEVLGFTEDEVTVLTEDGTTIVFGHEYSH